MDLAKQQAGLARKLMLRYNVRFDWSMRRFYCHGCKGLIVPGVNARVRVAKSTILTTCANCGRVNRKTLAQA
jgi:RNase P subunit RPR2